MRAGMAVETGGDRLFDLLRGVNLVIAQRDVVVLAHQQIQDVDIILARLRPIDQKPRPGPLAQRVIDVFGIVREHAKGAIAAHNGIGPGKAFHQNGGDFQLPGAGLPVTALARQLVDIVNRAKADDRWVKHVVDERLGVLRRFALIAVDIIGAEVLIAERIARDLQ